MPKEGNSSPIKVLMPFTSQQLVFLAGTLKPKGFVPCILAMREDCTLGQSVCGTQTPLGLTLLDLASAEGFLYTKTDVASQIGLTGISMGMSFPRLIVDCSDAKKHKVFHHQSRVANM